MTSARPDNAKKLGFVGGKYPCAYGPHDGDEGLLATHAMEMLSDAASIAVEGGREVAETLLRDRSVDRSSRPEGRLVLVCRRPRAQSCQIRTKNDGKHRH